MTAAHVRDVVVIGGGVAGMAATWTLRDRDVLLVEASNRLGGRLLSYPHHPYWLNLGAHLFPGAGSAVESLVNGLGLRTISIPGSTFGLVWDGTIYSRSRVELYPFSLPMSLRERLAFAVKGLKILSLVAAWRRSGRAGSTGSAPLSGRTFRSVVGRPPRCTPSPRLAARSTCSSTTPIRYVTGR